MRRDAIATFSLAACTMWRLGGQALPVHADDTLPLGSSRRPVVVLGAGGKLGKELVISLLRKGGYGVRACARGDLTTEQLGSADFPADDVDVMTGIDVTKPETLEQAVAGAGAVVFASSGGRKAGDTVDCLGAENVAKACIAAGVERLVVVSSLGVTRPDSEAFKFTNSLGNIMDYKEQGEQRVRKAYAGQDKLAYTIIRPGDTHTHKKHTHTSKHIHTHTHTHTHTSTHTRARARTLARTHLHAHARTFTGTRTHTHTHIHPHKH